MANDQPPKSPTLLPPRRSIELEDPGAHELDSENEDDVFSDAHEIRQAPSALTSSIPITRVEKVDNDPSYGQVPGTAAYDMRTQDAEPDVLAVIPEDGGSGSGSRASNDDRPLTPGGTPIPKTVVEKVDFERPSHGEVPGTAAHDIRKADAVPDVIIRASEDGRPSSSASQDESLHSKAAIPRTVVTRVDSQPAHGEVPGTDAYKMREADAEPDVLEKKGDSPSWPTSSLNRSSYFAYSGRKSPVGAVPPIAADGGFGDMDYDEDEDEENEPGVGHRVRTDEEGNNCKEEEGITDDFGEEFDDFEEGATADEFGDFDDGFQYSEEQAELEVEPEAPITAQQPFIPSVTSFPLLDFSELDTLDDFITATDPYLDSLYPATQNPLPPPAPPLPSENSIFLTPRSLSLWSQLVAPPPLQPPDWVRSRIRRLFLVSLGVPVDLDEILPASKQKKLILPSTHTRGESPRGGKRNGSIARLKHDNANGSSASVDSIGSSSSPSKHSGSGRGRRRGGLAPPPELDLGAAKMLCSTTDAALNGLTDGELRVHVERLEKLTGRAGEVLRYWLKRREGALGDKEAFEGVIENLVKHARKVRR